MQLQLARTGSHCCYQLRTAAATAAVLRPHVHLSAPVGTRNTYCNSSRGCIGIRCRIPTVNRHRVIFRLTSTVQCCSSGGLSKHVSCVSRRRLTVGAALTAATAGGVPWSWPARVSPGSSSSSMATAAAAPGSSASSSDTGVVVVYVTAPSSAAGEQLATALVQQQLVACVNLVPGLTSIYTWKGKVEKDSEVLLIMKTQTHLLEQLTAKVKELHPYDEPEVIALPVVGGSASYMQWVRDSTKG